MSQLLPVVLLAVFVVVFGSVLLFLASLIGAKGSKTATHMEAYECGVDVSQAATTRMPIKFYLTAILFILFDIEIIFMYPWALSYGDFINEGAAMYILSVMGVFLAVFIFGLFWEIKSRALEWE